ncbi:hypothetical protein AB0M42_15250 [Streptomyces sp. NPDC051784]|uniref:hypothetical protein n=1 Tax=Streptomyces sp. NPDC051784 TaxID=3155805 RepID=UPI00342F71E7
MVQKPQGDAEKKEGRIDLSLPQVAGSALAAVAAAVMASQLGVYGTIAGAGVMSVVATCGGSVFQHFFRRTGEQIREVTVQVKHPAGRQVTVRTKETYPASRRPEDEATRMLRTVDPGADRTTVLRQVRPGGAETDAERTTVLRQVRAGEDRDGAGADGAGADDSWSHARTHGTRVRGWKRSALAATGVFVLSMAGITVYEMASGHDLGGNGGTTIGSVVSGERHGGTGSPPPSDAPDTGTDEDDGTDPGTGNATAPGTGTEPGGGRSASPTPGEGDTATEPAPAPSASEGTTTPETTAPTTPDTGSTPPPAPDPSGAGQVPEQQDGAGADADR